jgi:hypothetical protein
VKPKDYHFEIVRRTYRRFSWRFVVIEEDGRRRVLDRSHRDYRSRKRVRRAILAMQSAHVDDCSGSDGDLFPLPATSFRIVGGVVPLMVDGSPVEFDASSLLLAVQAPAVEKPAVKPPAAQAPAVKAPAAQAPAVKPPAAQAPAVKPPAAQALAVKPPAVEKPAAQQRAVEQPAVTQPRPRPAGSAAARPRPGKKAT